LNNNTFVDFLKSAGYLKTSLIIDAFKRIDRKDFIPENKKANAYVNTPLSIGFGQTISQPIVVAFMMELLRPEAGECVLDVGSGSGWTTALLAALVGAKGRVVAIERIPALEKMTKENTSKYGFIKKRIVKVFCGDGTLGAPDDLLPPAGFDKILAGAAGNEIPEKWKKQLKIGGRIVAPVRDSIVMLYKTSAEKFKTKEFSGFRFVPLVKS